MTAQSMSETLKTRKEKLRDASGFTRLPHGLADLIYGGTLSRDDIRVLLAITRMTLGYNRPGNEIGGGTLSELTGIPVRNIWRVVNRLEHLQIIKVTRRKIEERRGHEERRANKYAINPSYFGDQKFEGDE